MCISYETLLRWYKANVRYTLLQCTTLLYNARYTSGGETIFHIYVSAPKIALQNAAFI